MLTGADVLDCAFDGEHHNARACDSMTNAQRREVRRRTSAVVLDFDGVVLQSAAIKSQAFAELFADRPERIEAIVELHERHGGLSRYRQFDMIYRDVLNEPLSQKESRLLGQRYSELVLDKVLQCPFVPGAMEFMATAPRDLPIFIASGSPHEELRLAIERREIEPFLSGFWGSPTEKPWTIRAVIDSCACTPDAVVVVGDAPSDHVAALETGTRFIGVVASGRASPFPSDTVIVEDLTSLAEVLPLARLPNGDDSSHPAV
jgi:beta-phosphoglucomutase-like phosphatase (HAD superfamily)